MLIAAVLLSPLACRLVMEGDTVLATLVAVKVQQTQLAASIPPMTASASQSEPAPFQPVFPSPPAGTETPTTASLPPGATSIPTPSDIIPDLDRRDKAAKILLFENMSASGQIRYVQEALERGGYFYLDVGSAVGWFKDQLLSSVDWDLIIAAAEARRAFGGDYFELIDSRLKAGSAVIVEYWDFDLAPEGKASGLLRDCGVEFQADWYEPQQRVFFWLAPENPIFHEPNEVPQLNNAASFWHGDIGDLMRVRVENGQPANEAVVLAGTYPVSKTSHGTLVSCAEGRMILQTFSSHEYQYNQVLNLWQNYIYQTLKSRFKGRPSGAPTPVSTMPVSTPPTPAIVEGPLPGVGNNFPCGDIFTGSLGSAVQFQNQLFEHNAVGSFLIVDLQLINNSQHPVQIWDGDYSVEGLLHGQPVSYSPQKAATGYLYIENPRNLYQDLIQPDIPWSTSLAFDVDSNGSSWVLVVKPGYELNEQVCELRIPLTQ
jgi:hypothetical protein